MYFSFARESHRGFYILHERVRRSRSTDDLNATFAIAKLRRSHVQVALLSVSRTFECRFIPHRTPIRAKNASLLLR